jgi:hypothetical protein
MLNNFRLSKQTNREIKRTTLVETIKEFHRAIKKLQKFVKSCSKFPKIEKLDVNFYLNKKLAAIMYSYGTYIHEVTDKLFFTNNMCKDFRLPPFDLTQANKFITGTCHQDLKIKISEGFNHFKFTEKKETIFDFYEKFGYNENYNKNDINYVIENMRKQIINILDINNEILKFNKFGEKVCFQYDKFIFTFGNLIEYKIIPLIPAGVDIICYYCYEINIISDKKYYSIIQPMKFLQHFNNELYNKIQIKVDNFTGLNIAELGEVLKEFNAKYILPDIFYYIMLFIRDYLDVKLRIPVSVKYESNSMSISLVNSNITEDFKLIVNLDQEQRYLYLNSSHELLSENPIVFVNNTSRRIGFNELAIISWEKLMLAKISEFRKIHLEKLISKLSANIRSCSMAIKCNIDYELEKASYFFERNLLFSIILNKKGGVSLADHEFLFKGKRDYFVKLDNIIQGYLSEQDNLPVVDLDLIIFSSFIETYFSLLNYKVTILKDADCFTLSYLILEHSLQRLTVDFVLRFKNNCVSILDSYMSLTNKDNVFKFNIAEDFNIVENLTKKDPKSINSRKLTSLLNETINKKFTENLLKSIHYFLTLINNNYEDFFRVFIDNFNLTPNLKVNPDMENLVIDWNEKNEVLQKIICNNFIEADNTDYFYKMFNKIHINTKNLIIRLYIKEDFLKTYFTGFNLATHCLFVNDYLIGYDNKELCISIYYLTKINNKSDNTQFKKFYSKTINKIINFWRKASPILTSKINK